MYLVIYFSIFAPRFAEVERILCIAALSSVRARASMTENYLFLSIYFAFIMPIPFKGYIFALSEINFPSDPQSYV